MFLCVKKISLSNIQYKIYILDWASPLLNVVRCLDNLPAWYMVTQNMLSTQEIATKIPTN